jgi:hypothetical protein
MSKQYPECPLYNHNTCKQHHNSKVCAIIRNDKHCLRDRLKNRKKTNESIGHSISVNENIS